MPSARRTLLAMILSAMLVILPVAILVLLGIAFGCYFLFFHCYLQNARQRGGCTACRGVQCITDNSAYKKQKFENRNSLRRKQGRGSLCFFHTAQT